VVERSSAAAAAAAAVTTHPSSIMSRLSLRAAVLDYLQHDLCFRLDRVPRRVSESTDNTVAYWCGVPDTKEVKHEYAWALFEKIAKHFDVDRKRTKPGQPFVTVVGRLYPFDDPWQFSLQLWDGKHEKECEILLRPSYFPDWFTKLLLSDYLNWNITIGGHADICNDIKEAIKEDILGYFLKKCPNNDLLSLGPMYYSYSEPSYTERTAIVQYNGVPVAHLTRTVDREDESSALILWISRAQRDAPEFVMPEEDITDLANSSNRHPIEFEGKNWHKIFNLRNKF
jgi:hypothetical protein